MARWNGILKCKTRSQTFMHMKFATYDITGVVFVVTVGSSFPNQNSQECIPVGCVPPSCWPYPVVGEGSAGGEEGFCPKEVSAKGGLHPLLTH